MNQESGPSGRGLLSKVVKFVKSPTTHWSDLDRPESVAEDSESRLALREMIERKRRNDFVRNREFDMLRKLRRRGMLGDVEGQPGQPSFYPSSQPANTGERALTLKKIDEIEAQMATVWLNRKGGDTRDGTASDATPAPQTLADPYGKTRPLGLDRDDPRLEPGRVQAFVPTELMSPSALDAQTGHAASAPQPQPVLTSAPAPVRAAGSAGLFGAVSDFNVEILAQAKQDPEIEEAAIRFANGDAAGAEAGLRALLGEHGFRRDDAETWLTLFDLLRAIGAQDRFDDTALDFAAHFGRSAPQWALESQAGGAPAEVAQATMPSSGSGRFVWTCPSTVGTQSVATLNATLARSAPPWRIDWSHLKAIEPAALPALTEAFRGWGNASVTLRFLGGERLLQLLAEHTPVDDRTVDPLWWEARLAMLRVLGEVDEFELVALNYCVTYEVSPPAWDEPQGSYRPLSDEGHTLPPPEPEAGAAVPPARSFAATDLPVAGAPSDGVARAELQGELLGDAEAALKTLTPGADSTEIELNCRQLLRVDFGAAGDLLNWAMAQQGLGRQVSFRQVHRLVAAFFGVVGITEAARVVLRSD